MSNYQTVKMLEEDLKDWEDNARYDLKDTFPRAFNLLNDYFKKTDKPSRQLAELGVEFRLGQPYIRLGDSGEFNLFAGEKILHLYHELTLIVSLEFKNIFNGVHKGELAAASHMFSRFGEYFCFDCIHALKGLGDEFRETLEKVVEILEGGE